LYLEGLALAAMNRHQDAIEAYMAAVQREAPTAELLAQLAQSQLKLGQVADAEQSVAQALSLDPRHTASRALFERLRVQRMAQAPR
jgi:tetratricopeptide (TPR) repeat protein